MSSHSLAGLRLLVIEDDALVRDVIVRSACDWGIEVDAADGGAAGVALLADNHYEVVITDLKMRGVTGLEVMERVCEAHPGTALIVITGFAEDGLGERVAKAGGLLLRKPFNLDGLRDALRWAMERTEELPRSR